MTGSVTSYFSLIIAKKNRLFVWVTILAIFLIYAYISKYLDLIAISGVLLFILVAHMSFLQVTATTPHLLVGIKRVSVVGVLLIGFYLASHHWSGFANPLLLENMKNIGGTRPLNFNIDKAIVGYVLLAYLVSFNSRAIAWRIAIIYSLFVSLVACIVLIPSAILIGYADWQPTIPNGLALWIASNLFVTCIAEEAYFRGFIQNRLQDSLTVQPDRAPIIALVMTSALFGIAHIGSGVVLACLAGIAGLFYGYVYQQTGRLAAAIFVHFSLNLTTLLTIQ